MPVDPSRGEILIRCDGVFDLRAVRLLEKTIAAATPGASFRVDLARVSEFDDFGLAVLAHVLERCGATPVALQGLRRHQARVLRYFGVDAARMGVRSVDDA